MNIKVNKIWSEILISVNRKILHFELIDIFLAEEFNPELTKKNVVVYNYSKVPGGNLFKEITYQIDLEKDESELLGNMSSGNRRKVRRAKKEPYVVIVKDNPTDQDLKEFQQFNNNFVKIKKIKKIDYLQMRRLKLLRNKGVLVFTQLQNTDGQVLCYQIHLIDNNLVLNLYTCTAAWIQNRQDLKQQINFANRHLLWENILFFKKSGYKIYDFGGITEISEINKFKEDFGFFGVETYHGLETKSIIGKILIKLHWRKIVYLF